MCSMTSMPQTPADLARAALKRIAELKLPPTPDHYARFYFEADAHGSGPQPIAAAEPAVGLTLGALPPTLFSRFDHLVESAVGTTGHLNDGLGRDEARLATSLEALVRDDAQVSRQILNEVAETTRDIHRMVKSSHEELLETRRGLAAIKSELAESRRLLSQDPLTGSDNRRAMESILAREIASARRNQEPLSIVMIDIDRFKQINDSHGHPAGDAALIHLAQAARALLRGNDAFVRYGGDEFVLVLPETDSKGAVIAGERLRAVLVRQPLLQGQQKLVLTLSGGVSSLRPEDDTDSLLARADAALYTAKRQGRDRICLD